MLDSIIALDHRITLAMNAVQTPFWDSVMLFLSSHTVWIPLYVCIAASMFIPKWYGVSAPARFAGNVPFWITELLGLAVAAACFGFTDQFTNVIKGLAERPRPGNDPLLEGLLNLPEGRGGGFSFVSAHAANTMSFAMLTALIFRRRLYSAIMIAWSVAIGFSRIYLSKHFTSDVICGLLTGILIALLFYWIYRLCLKALAKYHNKKTCTAS